MLLIDSPSIETPRLFLIGCTQPVLEAISRGHRSLGLLLGVDVPLLWTEFGEDIFHYALDRIIENPEETKWWSYLPILKEENVLVGSCGYKGPPDKEGVVEIGYEVAHEYRNRGLATELARGLIEHAFQHPAVTAVKAHTHAEINASGSVLQKCGMKKTAELFDPDDGEVWLWNVLRP
jgi:[ribosomal protein S5]-alanine N-acetyltransferase